MSHWPVTILSTLSSFVAMLLPLVLVRILDPAALGSFKIFFLYLMVLPPLTLISGVRSGLAYWAGRGEPGIKAIQTSAVLTFAISILSLTIMLLLRFPIAESLHLDVKMVTLFSFGLFLGIASPFFDEAAVAMGKVWSGALFHSGFELVRVGVIVAVALLTRDLTQIILAHLAVQLVKVTSGYFLSYRYGLLKFTWDSSTLKAIGRYAFPVSLASVFGLFLNYSDQIILSKLVSSPDFALYTVCCLSVPPLLILEASLTRVLIPQLSRAFAERQPKRVAQLYRQAVQSLGFLIIPAVIGMAVFAAPIIELLFTRAYLPGVHFLRLYSLWYLTLLIPPDAIARAQGEARWMLGNFISFSFLTIVLCGVLARFYGPTGALVGLLLARGASRLYTAIYMKKVLSCRIGEFIPLQALSKMLCIGLVLGAVSWGMRSMFSTPISWFFFCGIGFTFAYLGLALLWVTDQSPRTRKVLMLTPGLFIGGLERMILNLSKGLKQHSVWKPQVFAYDFRVPRVCGTDLLESFAYLGIPVRSTVKPPRFSFRTAIGIARQVSGDSVTVIHTHDLGALIYGILAKFILFRKVRVVHTQHSFVHLNRSWKYRYYEKIFTWFADSVAVVSEDTRRGYIDLGVHEERLHVIANGVDFPEEPDFDRTHRIARRGALIHEHSQVSALSTFRSDYWILYLARVHGRKGQDHALRLWAELAPRVRAECTLLFVGPESDPGELKRLQIIAENLPDSERVVFAGASQVPHDWIRASDMFLSSSEFEGMPLAPVEAIGSGVPALLSRIAGHEFLSSFADLYPFQQAHLGAESVERAFQRTMEDDAAFRQECWIRTQSIRESFTLRAMSRQYEKLYEVTP